MKMDVTVSSHRRFLWYTPGISVVITDIPGDVIFGLSMLDVLEGATTTFRYNHGGETLYQTVIKDFDLLTYHNMVL